MTTKRAILALFLALLTAAAGFAQGRRGYGGRSGGARQRTENKDNPAQDPLATLPGAVKAIDKKMLIIEDAQTNTLQFHSSKKTSYLDGTKKIKPEEIKPGDRVTVEARRELDGSLEAVNIHLEHPKQR